MSFFPIALTTPQYVDSNGDPASGFVLKAYAAGTSTNISMATDSTGDTTATSMALNANGYPEVSATIVIPHLDKDYKLSLYPTQAAADANSGATWTIDNLSNTLFFNLAQLSSVAGTNTITATSSPTIGSYVVDDLFIFSPANANTGSVTLNIDSEGAGAVQLNGAALASGELQTDVPVIVQVTAVTPVFEIVANGNMMSKSGGTFTGTVTYKQGSDIASATALPVDASGNLFDVTGTATVTSLNSKGVGTVITLQFDGALILTHHATNLILPGAADITTAAGDIATLYEYASGDWRCVSYQRANLTPEKSLETGTVVDVSSGAPTAADFTSIPSWVTRITVILDDISTSGTDNLLIQLGDSGGIEATGYSSVSEGGATAVSSTTGFIIQSNSASQFIRGHMLITKITGDRWINSHTVGRGTTGGSMHGGGGKTLSGPLDRVRVTVTGADTFDLGQANLFFE